MTLTLFALLSLALGLLALAGPRLVRWSSPLLMRAPRLASGLLLGALAVWSTAAVVLSVALAGLPSGPRLLAGSAADVCQRCLAAASPFSAAPVELPVPMAALLLLPLVGTVLMGAAAVRGLLRRARSIRAVLAEVRTSAVRTVLAGHRVLLVPDPTPLAFALPRRRGGIVVSHGLLDSLGADELSAVLEHEAAHLSQHHHALLAVLEAMVGPLRVIPLFDAVATTVPHLLEIAADDASRHRSGTPGQRPAHPRRVRGARRLDRSGGRARCPAAHDGLSRPGDRPDRAPGLPRRRALRAGAGHDAVRPAGGAPRRRGGRHRPLCGVAVERLPAAAVSTVGPRPASAHSRRPKFSSNSVVTRKYCSSRRTAAAVSAENTWGTASGPVRSTS